MFEAARLKLTLWYVVVIMIVTGVFSSAFYFSSTREISLLIKKIESNQERTMLPPTPQQRMHNYASLEELYALKAQSLHSLLLLNILIFFFSVFSGFILSGRTLRPIQDMLERQKRFISNASHELKTPVAVMRAQTEAALMDAKLTKQELKEALISNLEEIETLQGLTASLLRLTTTAEKQKTTWQQFQLDKLVSMVAQKLQPLARKKSIVLQTRLESVSMTGSREDISELCSILIENAIKHSPEKSSVSITLKKERRGVYLLVEDSGNGVVQDDLPFLFDRFYRSAGARSSTDGYGLGLAIAKDIVTTHGGSISAHAKKDKKGSVFVVRM
ncbi:HAMP domain-containing histidine kinase [Candidatus Woesebacteria bacterium]|nr:HAMP domain-containing histidine kinase [Candidatus Woesebacteria bacterium]MCB9801592.1 HAMP domain-containing histidine kinase [Pseudomonadales bacterium]